MTDLGDNGIYKTMAESIQEALSNVYKDIEPIQETFKQIFTGLQEIPNSTKILSECGWYLPFDFHPQAVNNLVSEFESGNSKIIDDVMIDYLDSEINNIEIEIIKKFPNRKAVLQAAIKAHNNHDYYLSIPVFFSQIEGICNELTGTRFFQLRNQQPQTTSWVSNFNSAYLMGILLKPLKYVGPMRKKQNLSNPIGINRHDVLHGDCVDYGEDRLNSYKTLSLLNYISDTVFEAKKYLDKK